MAPSVDSRGVDLMGDLIIQQFNPMFSYLILYVIMKMNKQVFNHNFSFLGRTLSSL